jgi:hypothetical protein
MALGGRTGGRLQAGSAVMSNIINLAKVRRQRVMQSLGDEWLQSIVHDLRAIGPKGTIEALFASFDDAELKQIGNVLADYFRWLNRNESGVLNCNHRREQ